MIIQTLATIFIIAYVAIVAFGHVLLLRATFTPAEPPAKPQPSPPQPREDQLHHAPFAASRIAP